MLYVARWLYDCRERIPRIYPWGECQDPDTWVDKSRVEDVKRTQEYVVIITGGRSCAVKRTTEGCWSSIDAVGATETLILVDGINGIITVYPKRVRKEYGLPHNPKVVISEEK
jgi:hypothetical protein